MFRVILGTAILLVPVVLIAFSQTIIRLMAPDDPVPQGGMVCFGLLLILSLFVSVPLGIFVINSADKNSTPGNPG